MTRLRQGETNLAQSYLRYNAHVSRTTYGEVEAALEARLAVKEQTWPEYKDSTAMVDCPRYLRSQAPGPALADVEGCSTDDGARWLESYLTDVQGLQEFKQNHVHPINLKTNQREPLTACRRKDNPALCKGDFPRSERLIQRAVILCPGLLRRLSMPFGGRRSKLGSMHGPMNHAYLNGTHPAMLVAMRFNSDVQLPYRFPITQETHDVEMCGDENCVQACDDEEIIESCQSAQNAQALRRIKPWRSTRSKSVAKATPISV